MPQPIMARADIGVGLASVRDRRSTNAARVRVSGPITARVKKKRITPQAQTSAELDG